MRTKGIVLLVIAIVVVLAGCGIIRERGILSERLITVQQEEIDRVQADYVKEEGVQSEDKEVIGRLYSALSGIKMEKITTEQEMNLMQGTEMEYLITFISKKNAVGHALFFSTGDVVMPDLKTVDETKPTQSYVHYKLSREKLDEIEGILGGLKQ